MEELTAGTAGRAGPEFTPALLVQWPLKLAQEVVLAPWTIGSLRRALTELPEKIDGLSEALDRTTTDLDATVNGLAADLTSFKESLDDMLPTLSALVTGMDGRVEHLEAMVSDLGNSVVTVLNVIPGVARRIRATRAPELPPSEF